MISDQEMSTVLVHASQCACDFNLPCPNDPNCKRLKLLLSHTTDCAMNNCIICAEINSLSLLHTMNCQRKQCTFFKCVEIRSHQQRTSFTNGITPEESHKYAKDVFILQELKSSSSSAAVAIPSLKIPSSYRLQQHQQQSMSMPSSPATPTSSKILIGQMKALLISSPINRSVAQFPMHSPGQEMMHPPRLQIGSNKRSEWRMNNNAAVSAAAEMDAASLAMDDDNEDDEDDAEVAEAERARRIEAEDVICLPKRQLQQQPNKGAVAAVSLVNRTRSLSPPSSSAAMRTAASSSPSDDWSYSSVVSEENLRLKQKKSNKLYKKATKALTKQHVTIQKCQLQQPMQLTPLQQSVVQPSVQPLQYSYSAPCSPQVSMRSLQPFLLQPLNSGTTTADNSCTLGGTSPRTPPHYSSGNVAGNQTPLPPVKAASYSNSHSRRPSSAATSTSPRLVAAAQDSDTDLDNDDNTDADDQASVRSCKLARTWSHTSVHSDTSQHGYQPCMMPMPSPRSDAMFNMARPLAISCIKPDDGGLDDLKDLVDIHRINLDDDCFLDDLNLDSLPSLGDNKLELTEAAAEEDDNEYAQDDGFLLAFDSRFDAGIISPMNLPAITSTAAVASTVGSVCLAATSAATNLSTNLAAIGPASSTMTTTVASSTSSLSQQRATLATMTTTATSSYPQQATSAGETTYESYSNTTLLPMDTSLHITAGDDALLLEMDFEMAEIDMQAAADSLLSADDDQQLGHNGNGRVQSACSITYSIFDEEDDEDEEVEQVVSKAGGGKHHEEEDEEVIFGMLGRGREELLCA